MIHDRTSRTEYHEILPAPGSRFSVFGVFGRAVYFEACNLDPEAV